MKVFFDSNIWLRFVLDEDTAQRQQCVALLEQAESGAIRPYTSAIVLLEVNYVLRSFYKINEKETAAYLENILQTRNLVIEERTNFHRAWQIHQKTAVKLADCLIAFQVRSGVLFCTFDTEFKKLPSFASYSPAEVLGKLKKLKYRLV